MTDFSSQPQDRGPNLYEIYLLFSRGWKLLLGVFFGLMLVATLVYLNVNHHVAGQKRVTLISLGGYYKGEGIDSGGGVFEPFLDVVYVEHQIEEKFGDGPFSIVPMQLDMLAAKRAETQAQVAPYRPADTVKLVASLDFLDEKALNNILAFVRQLEEVKREEVVQRMKHQIEFNNKMLQDVDLAKNYKVMSAQGSQDPASMLVTGLSVEKLRLMRQNYALESHIGSMTQANIYLTYVEKFNHKRVGPLRYFVLVAMISALVALLVVFLAGVIKQQAREYHQR